MESIARKIYAREMLFLFVECLFTLRSQINVPLLIILGKFEDPPPPPLLINFYNSPRSISKKIDIYNTISHRCSLANSLHVFGTPDSEGMFLYIKYNAYFAMQLYIHT